jgi:hypothetical protein
MFDPLPLLNIYEIDDRGTTRHLVGFLDQVRAGAVGIASRAMVGEFTPRPDGEFDVTTFRPNPEFIAALAEYMNAVVVHDSGVIAQAKAQPGGRMLLVDPRRPFAPDEMPPGKDLVGGFDVDADGRIVPGSFQYNALHAWFDPEFGVSGLLEDRRFYDWLHLTEGFQI